MNTSIQIRPLRLHSIIFQELQKVQKLISNMRISFSLSLLVLALLGCVATEEPSDPEPIRPVQEKTPSNKVALLIPTSSEEPGRGRN